MMVSSSRNDQLGVPKCFWCALLVKEHAESQLHEGNKKSAERQARDSWESRKGDGRPGTGRRSRPAADNEDDEMDERNGTCGPLRSGNSEVGAAN